MNTDPGKTLSQTALAQALGLSKANITKLKQQGMPVDSVEAARAWRLKRQNIAQRKPEPGSRPPPAASSAPPGRDAEEPRAPGESFEDARTRREIAAANILELQEAEERKELLRREVMEQTVGALAAGTREAVLQVPARVAALLAAESDAAKVRQLLDAELRQALEQAATA